MEREVQLRQWVDESARGSYETDSGMLIQILTNLLQNAVRHTQAGFIEVHACVLHPSSQGLEAAKNSDVVQLTVSDSGSGMSASTASSCFDKYTTSNGVGLGLYLAQLQVQQLGGRVEAPVSPWTADHPGTQFRLTLPLAVSPPPPKQASLPVAPSCDAPLAPLRFAPELHVLIADDIRMKYTQCCSNP